jgi:hypothetical protein
MNEMKLRKFTRMSREDRLCQLFGILERSRAPLTATQIAKRAGMAKSAHLMSMLAELAHDGDAFVFEHCSAAHLPTLYYAYLDQTTEGAEYRVQLHHWEAMLPGGPYTLNGDRYSDASADLPF